MEKNNFLAKSLEICGGGGRVSGREAYLDFYVGGVHHVPKILVMGQSNGSF
jgi:hypothetical protein